jgi:hypothetical protein
MIVREGEFGENSLRRHGYDGRSRDVSTASRGCWRGSWLNMTGTGGLVEAEGMPGCGEMHRRSDFAQGDKESIVGELPEAAWL